MTATANATVSLLGIPERATPGLNSRVSDAIAGVASDIVSTTTLGRTDRLWPSDVLVYQTNSLNLAYGACGTALFLRGALGQLPREAEEWIRSQRLSTDTHPPGLYVGLAGIARAFAWFGWQELAENAMNLVYESPLLFEEVGVDHGMAGWGLASLSMYSETSATQHLDFALAAGERLLKTATTDENGRYWPSHFDGRAYLGYAYGTCGVACFLLRLYEVTGDERFKVAAIEGMDFTLRQGRGNAQKYQWPSYIGGRITYPYWRLGGAGIGGAFLRFYQTLHDESYLRVAKSVASGSRMLFAAVPGQFDGMSSVGDFLLDMYCVTGDEEYYRHAQEIAESILCFQVPTDGGITFPGRLLMRLSSDYAHGSAGVASFLERILAPTAQSLDARLYRSC